MKRQPTTPNPKLDGTTVVYSQSLVMLGGSIFCNSFALLATINTAMDIHLGPYEQQNFDLARWLMIDAIMFFVAGMALGGWAFLDDRTSKWSTSRRKTDGALPPDTTDIEPKPWVRTWEETSHSTEGRTNMGSCDSVLRFKLSPVHRINIDGQAMDITVSGIEQSLNLSGEADKPIRESTRLVLKGAAFPTEAEARNAAERAKTTFLCGFRSKWPVFSLQSGRGHGQSGHPGVGWYSAGI
jgi:hypothetical protein